MITLFSVTFAYIAFLNTILFSIMTFSSHIDALYNTIVRWTYILFY